MRISSPNANRKRRQGLSEARQRTAVMEAGCGKTGLAL
jgi:hypothetical protein